MGVPTFSGQEIPGQSPSSQVPTNQKPSAAGGVPGFVQDAPIDQAELMELIGQIPEEVATGFLEMPPEQAMTQLLNFIMDQNQGINASGALSLAKIIYAGLQEKYGESRHNLEDSQPGGEGAGEMAPPGQQQPVPNMED